MYVINAIPEWNCCLQISSNVDSFTEFVGLNLSRHHQPM
jgi:hypothetical protein